MFGMMIPKEVNWIRFFLYFWVCDLNVTVLVKKEKEEKEKKEVSLSSQNCINLDISFVKRIYLYTWQQNNRYLFNSEVLNNIKEN